MMIRLNVTAAGRTTTFEHLGPVVRIGRDPACDLTFEGEAASGVSRQHALIELSPAGATLADAGSSNGTLHNDKPVEGPVALRAGDRINLGYTGPALTVLALDLRPVAVAAAIPAAAVPVAELLPAEKPAPPASPPLALVGVGVVAAVAVLAVVAAGAYLVMNRPGGSTEQVVEATPTKPAPVTPVATIPSTPDKGTTPAPKVRPKVTPPEEEPQVKPPTDPEAPQEKEVGQYVALKEWGPSVLLTRRGENNPWAPLRPEKKIVTAHDLLSLPGYRSEVLLDSGVQLTLWGNIPEFCGEPPTLLESAAMLNAPEPGTDLDVTLEWGRIKVANHKKTKEPAHVRLRFERQVWDLTLAAPDGEAVVELWSRLPHADEAVKRKQLALTLGLFTSKAVTLHRNKPDETLELADHTRVAWASGNPKLFQTVLPEKPVWWAKPPDPKNDALADLMISLDDWSAKLGGVSDEPAAAGPKKGSTADDSGLVTTILKEEGKSADQAFRELGMYFLAALNEPGFLVSRLEDGKSPRVRRAAAHALRCYLSRGADRSAKLRDYLKVKADSPEKAALILTLLHPFPPDQLRDPAARQKIIQQLVADLNDDSLAVREMASWHLEGLAPQTAKKIAYNAAADAGQRQQVVAEWQKELSRTPAPR
jgi:hypothetical protein